MGASVQRLRLVSAWLLLGALLAACADKPASPFDAAAVLCEGTWVALPHPLGPSPPPGFEQLRIDITDRPGDGKQSVFALGTVSWDGRQWPMSCEVGTHNGDLGPFCRYAPGHPFTASPDPEGFAFVMLVGEG